MKINKEAKKLGKPKKKTKIQNLLVDGVWRDDDEDVDWKKVEEFHKFDKMIKDTLFNKHGIRIFQNKHGEVFIYREVEEDDK